MTSTEHFFTESVEVLSNPLRTDLLDLIKARYSATPRHRQRELGPSDISHPCSRRLALQIMEAPENNHHDPLPSIIGTATHTWLESAAEHANSLLDHQRWHAEFKVNVGHGVTGTCDLYDADTQTVIDWKVPGTTRFNMYKHDPGPVYRTQIFLYGKGVENAGFPVKKVAIAFVPAGRTLKSFHLWEQDYDPRVAEYALHRREIVIQLLDDFRTEDYPQTFSWFPIEPYDCIFCPFFSLKPNSHFECKGATP